MTQVILWKWFCVTYDYNCLDDGTDVVNNDDDHGGNIKNVFLQRSQVDYEITRGCSLSSMFYWMLLWIVTM